MAFATIGTTGIADDAVTSAKVAPGVVDTEAQPNQTALIINGDMAVSQRSTSVASITDDGYHTIDRFKLLLDTLGTWTQTQESLTSGNAYTDGFSNALKMDCTTADGSPAAGDRMFLYQRLEGQDLQLLKKGTANAEKLTLSFWVKATKTGTNICELGDNDNSRKISQSYTISSSDTWEKKVINFAADTTGVLGDDNGASLDVVWWLGAGTNYTSGTLNSSWNGSVANANRAVGQVNHADSTSNNFHITGVQLEVGEFTSSTIPPFKHESYGDNLLRCQRYYYLHASGNSKSLGRGGYYSNSQAEYSTQTPVIMRTNPTLEIASGSNYYVVYRNGGSDNVDDFSLNTESTKEAVSMFNNSDASGTAGDAGHFVTNNSSAKVALTAEL